MTYGDEVVQLRRELERLREENQRLSRLLELRGQETIPAPEQPAAAPPSGELVTMASPVADKLALFTDLFHARTDVYALRWENTRTGASGWSPAVAGGWRKGLDRRAVRYLPLRQEVIAAHLVGDVFVGLYPLLTDNSCRFLAADFDGPAAMLDALAYTKAARAQGVPTTLEISQSNRRVDRTMPCVDRRPRAGPAPRRSSRHRLPTTTRLRLRPDVLSSAQISHR